MFRLPALFALIALGVACAAGEPLLPFDKDPLPVIERYPHRVADQCSAWLVSHISGYKYCSSPKVDLALGGPTARGPVAVASTAAAGTATETAAPTFSKTDGPTDLAGLQAHGQVVYDNVCTACHGPTGEGVPGAFPPLAGSDYFGDASKHARIIVHGLSGEIVVKGVTWNGVMPAQGGALTDYDIAAVATFERNAWGNAGGMVTPEDVAAIR